MMAQTQYAVVTSIESIIPAGLGRSRMIVNKEDLNTANFTTVRTDGVKSDMGTVKREDLKMAAVGWELTFVTTGVESEAGTTDGEGIFVTRYIFKR